MTHYDSYLMYLFDTPTPPFSLQYKGLSIDFLGHFGRSKALTNNLSHDISTENSDGDLHGRLPPLPPEYSGSHPVPPSDLDCGHCGNLGVPGHSRPVLLLCKYLKWLKITKWRWCHVWKKTTTIYQDNRFPITVIFLQYQSSVVALVCAGIYIRMSSA